MIVDLGDVVSFGGRSNLKVDAVEVDDVPHKVLQESLQPAVQIPELVKLVHAVSVGLKSTYIALKGCFSHASTYNVSHGKHFGRGDTRSRLIAFESSVEAVNCNFGCIGTDICIRSKSCDLHALQE